MNQSIQPQSQVNSDQGGVVTIQAKNVQSSVLKRLIEEVKSEGVNYVNAYDRTHSRHNRGR